MKHDHNLPGLALIATLFTGAAFAQETPAPAALAPLVAACVDSPDAQTARDGLLAQGWTQAVPEDMDRIASLLLDARTQTADLGEATPEMLNEWRIGEERSLRSTATLLFPQEASVSAALWAPGEGTALITIAPVNAAARPVCTLLATEAFYDPAEIETLMGDAAPEATPLGSKRGRFFRDNADGRPDHFLRLFQAADDRLAAVTGPDPRAKLVLMISNLP